MFRQPLRNCLKDYRGMYVKIHSANGQNHWFCDKLTYYSYKVIQDISDKYHNQLKNLSKNKKYRLANLDTIYDTKIANQKERAKHSPALKKKLNLYIEKCNKKRERERELLPKQIMTIGGQLKKWIALLERKVLDVYPSICPDEPNTMIIVIRGQEKGRFWTVKEYQDRDKKEKRGLHDGINK